MIGSIEKKQKHFDSISPPTSERIVKILSAIHEYAGIAMQVAQQATEKIVSLKQIWSNKVVK